MPKRIYVHSLSPEEVEALQQLRKQTDEADVRSRCEMILHSNNGQSTSEIAQLVPFSHDTVLRVIRRYESQGLAGLPKTKPTGRPPTVTPEWRQELERAVDTAPRQMGLPFSNWSSGRLATYLSQQSGITVSEDTVERYLKLNRWRLRRPVQTVSHKQDQQAVAEKKNEIDDLIETARQDPNTIVLFQDEATLSLLPTLTRMWTRIGQQPKILTPGVRPAKRQAFGLVDPVRGEFGYLFHPRRNKQGFRRQIGWLARHYELARYPQRKVYLILDNASAHKCKWVKRLLEKYPGRIILVFLPAYSQELNAIEFFWRHMRRIVTHNHYFETLEALLTAAREFFETMMTRPVEVLSIIGFNA